MAKDAIIFLNKIVWAGMTLNLYIEQNDTVRLSLLSGGEALDGLAWKENNNLSRTLLANLDKLARKNGVGVDKISGYKIISEVPWKWTTYRIAQITFKSLGLAK